eukprot:COSAG01_NODE_17016_length_1184_cov_28.803687_2_plen_83_part_00
MLSSAHETVRRSQPVTVGRLLKNPPDRAHRQGGGGSRLAPTYVLEPSLPASGSGVAGAAAVHRGAVVCCPAVHLDDLHWEWP